MLQDILGHAVKKEGQKAVYSFLDILLQYAPINKYPQKNNEAAAEEEEESVLEAGLEEPAEVQKEDDSLPLRYAPLEENVLGDFSYDGKAAHDSMYGSITSLLSGEEEEYKVIAPANDIYDAGLSADEEVKGWLQEAKYEIVVPPEVLECEEKKKIATWILFNPALFAFLESFYGLDRDVDYRAVA